MLTQSDLKNIIKLLALVWLGMVVIFVLMELVNNYLAIEQIRFKDRLSITRDLDQRAMSVPVPAMLLQPVVEKQPPSWHRWHGG